MCVEVVCHPVTMATGRILRPDSSRLRGYEPALCSGKNERLGIGQDVADSGETAYAVGAQDL